MSTQWQAPPPVRPRAPLTKRLRAGHWVALDYIAALVCLPVMFLSLHAAFFPPGDFTPGREGSVAVFLLLAAGLSAPVALRRRQPLAALTAAAGIASVSAVLAALQASMRRPPFPPAAPTIPVLFLPAAYVLYLVAATSRRTVAVGWLAAVLVLLFAGGLSLHPALSEAPGATIVVALLVIAVWTVGYAVGQRRAYAGQLRDQAAKSAVTGERLRIARELHDVVAHSMTVIAVQAGFGRHVIDAQPAQASGALEAIQATSREALAEMRRMLGVLRQSSAEPFGGESGASGSGSADRGTEGNGSAGNGNEAAVPLMPAPGLADLDRLVSRIANAGVGVDLQVTGSPRQLPPGVDLSAFRIVQEALTNVVKHAETRVCRVRVSYDDDALSIEVTDAGRGCPVPAAAPPGQGNDGLPGGHGLIGMRERVSLYGGELTAAPLPERGFRVAARLPVGSGTP